jgi:hypothetical protein
MTVMDMENNKIVIRTKKRTKPLFLVSAQAKKAG